MIRRSLLKFCAVAVLAGAAFAGPAGAQLDQANQNKNYDSDGTPYSSQYKSIYPKGVFVSLMRMPGMPNNMVTLRLGLEHQMSGCPKLSPLASEVQVFPGEMEVLVADYRLDMRDLPQNPHYECAQGQQTPSADIVLSRDDLIANDTKMLRLRFDRKTDIYDVVVTPQSILLMPASNALGQSTYFKPLNVARVENPLKFWFYPENTMILYAPDVDAKTDVSLQIREMAAAQGLEPLETVYPGFRSPVKDPNYFYYVDSKGKYASTVKESPGYVVGQIGVEKSVYGLVADEKIVQNIDVYAKRPGTYD